MNRTGDGFDRRRFLAIAGTGAVVTIGGIPGAAAASEILPYPFAMGVASGDATHNRLFS